VGKQEIGEFTAQDKYRYSVLDTCTLLHGQITGSSAELGWDTFRLYVRWLDWRVGVWSTSILKDHEAYDETVKQLARITLSAAADYIIERGETECYLLD
jgi:hypothetical protein